MLRFFFKKQLQVESLVYTYLDNLGVAQKHFGDALNMCMENGVCENFDFLTDQTHKSESRADDIIEDIKNLMYGKALLPESRGDIMQLVEAIDVIPGHFQMILYMIKTQKLVIPDCIVPDIKELIEVSLGTCDLMIKQIHALFKREEGIRELFVSIDHNESHCDHIERRTIAKIFDSGLDPFQKVLLKEMIVCMGEISDQAERVSKLVNIISMKRIV